MDYCSSMFDGLLFCEHGSKPVISIKARALLSSQTVSVISSRNSVFISLK